MPDELDRYKILEEIGQGGFAVVYRAQDTTLDRPVALKELRQNFVQDNDWVQRFTREAKTIAKLNHPRIVTIHDILEVDKRLFIVMRLVDGPSLDKVITDQGPLPWSEALEIFTALADALDYAHSHDILHRDLKPANILLDRERGPQLSDFGLAKLVTEGDTSVTAAGAIVGTPNYIAPEMWEGEGSSQQSDIYALGCILYEMLTGKKLFEGASPPAVMMAHFNPLNLPEVWPEQVPEGIGEVLESALARDPEARYATATEMANGLIRLSQGQAGAADGSTPQSTPLIIQPPTPRATHNLPAQTTAFIGRQAELAELHRLLADDNIRLLTLLGPGGTGKTRLMLQLGSEVIDKYADGVWLVELAPLTDPTLIAERVATALNVQEQPGRQMLDTLAEYLRRKELLLLLDNVEHVVRESAKVAEHLLAQCPKLNLLVTGREALFISGETTVQIPSLSLPEPNENLTPDAIADAEAVQLFVERAKAVRPDFDLTPQNAVTLAEIVQRLDGIPLALELAAARLRMLTVEQIAERLNDRFRLLTGGRRTALPRQQTLQALIDWSWNLLDEKERLLLRRLSVFSGGWSLEAAQAVTSDDQLDEYDIFDNLEQLVNKSLVIVDHPPKGEARYGLLESIHQYARDRLFEAGEGEALRDRHADYFVAFAEEAAPHLVRSTMMPWVKRIILELDNLRTVMAWTLDNQPEMALRLSAALLREDPPHWLTPREARSWLEPAIDKTRALLQKEDTNVRQEDFIKALLGLASIYGIQGNRIASIKNAEESIQLAREAGALHHMAYGIVMKTLQTLHDMPPDWMREIEEAIVTCRENAYDLELGLLLNVAGVAHNVQGNPESAIPYIRESIEVFREINNPHFNVMAVLQYQGVLAKMEGNLEEAKRYQLRWIEQAEALNDRRLVTQGQGHLAHVFREEGNLEEAETYYKKSIVGWQELGHLPAVAHQLECFAFIAIAKGKYEYAARLLGTAKETREQLDSVSTDPQEIAELAQAMEQLAAAMGETERDKVLAEGKMMSLDDAVTLALEGAS